jgi:hypothetical protein
MCPFGRMAYAILPKGHEKPEAIVRLTTLQLWNRQPVISVQ